MTYLPLTRLVAAAGGLVLPLMAGEALAMPTAKTASFIESQSVTPSLDPGKSVPAAIGPSDGRSLTNRMEVDK